VIWVLYAREFKSKTLAAMLDEDSSSTLRRRATDRR
jgi:hypothetical protein